MSATRLVYPIVFAFAWGVASSSSATPVTTGLQLWLDAADSSTILDPAGLSPGEAGFTGSIAQWTDKSSNGLLATSSAGSRPTYDPLGLNGSPTLVFGGGQLLSLSSEVTTSDETTFVVTRMFDDGDNRGPWLGNSTSELGHGVPGSFFNDRDRYFVGTSDGLFGFVPESAPTTDTIVAESRAAGVANIDENGN